jgi:hypothetical protein
MGTDANDSAVNDHDSEKIAGDAAADEAAGQENSLGYSTGLDAPPDEAEEDVAEGVSNPGGRPD